MIGCGQNEQEGDDAMSQLSTIATSLRFPEGPVAMPDGSVIVVEIAAGRITRVRPDGTKETVAEPGGGPNGLAIGPDGKLYCCNNGGFRSEEHTSELQSLMRISYAVFCLKKKKKRKCK